MSGTQKALGGEGLRGQSAGSTALCTVGKTGTGLTYRGYDISDLAAHAEFEEVAYLLLKGEPSDQSRACCLQDKANFLSRITDGFEGCSRTDPLRCPSNGCAANRVLNAWEP